MYLKLASAKNFFSGFHQVVKVVVRVGGLGVTMETVQKEGATEAEAVAAVAMTVAVLTAVVDTIVAEEVDLLVWGKLHSATAPKVPFFTEI